MSKSPVHAFFLGRAIAKGVYEQLESLFANTLSELGKFDAEQRENLRQFCDRVMEQASLEAETQLMTGNDSSYTPTATIQPRDLQATIDELRAEVAQVRAELQRYRSRSV